MHNLLLRQLKRCFAGGPVPGGIEPLLEAVDEAYRQSDEDRQMLERSLDLSSRELLETNAELRALLGGFPDLCFHLDRDGTILECKGGSAEDYLLPHDQLVGRRFQDVPVPAVRAAFREVLARLGGAPAPVSLEYGLDHPEGRLHFEARLLPLPDGRFIAIVRNITERTRAEEARRKSQDLLDAIIQGLPFPQFVLDRDHRVLYWNHALEEQSGMSAEAMVGTRDQWKPFYPAARPTLADVVVDGDDEALERHYQGKYWMSTLVSGAYEAIDFIPLVRGTGRWLHFGVVAIRDASGTVVGAVESLEDITDLIQTQESLSRTQDQLRQSQKMEAVGRLAGGVAHDFNNLLTVIRGRCDVARARGGDPDSLAHSFQEISRAAERAAGLTQQLLAFSRQQVMQPRLLDLNRSVREMDALLRRIIGEDIELRVELEPSPRSVMADPGQIEQVIMNLVVNARDAMPDGGRITVRTANVSAAEGAREGCSALPGAASVMLSVTDTGCGMAPETLTHIFEPFFTTKHISKGTGLGLSTVYGIVEQSHGRIRADSEPGRGSVFEIHLPAVQGGGAIVETAARPAGLPHGCETVLLVEDEDVVRDVAREMLLLAGYTVLEARDGGEALRVSDAHGGPIELLLTDLIMPGMGGRELAGRFLERRPGAGVLFTSGYSNDEEFRSGSLDPGRAFLQKPYSVETLATRVREVLDARAPEHGSRAAA